MRFKEWKEPWFDEDGYAFLQRGPYDHKYFGWRCLNFGNLKLGEKCDVAHGCLIQAKHGVEIGEQSEIGPFCYISSWDTEDGTEGKVIIGKNVMIGAHSTILPNSVIPDNTKIPAYSIIMSRENKRTWITKTKKEWEML